VKVALVQYGVARDTRSANIVHLMRSIDRACEHDPAPDLVVLPAACENSPASADAANVTRAMGDAFAGLLAMKAREWGVFVAGGYRTRDNAGALIRGVLIDPDGDTMIATARGDGTASMLARIWTTPIGSVGLLLGEYLGKSATDAEAEPCGLLIVSGSGPNGMAKASDLRGAADQLRKLAIRLGCHVCGAFPLFRSRGDRPPTGGLSGVYAPDGTPVVQAPAREAVVLADLAVCAKAASG